MATENRSSNTNAPCPFCGGQVDPEGWLRGDGARGPECESCGATAPNLELWNSAQPAQQHQGEPVECAHEWTDDGEFLLVCTNCGQQEDHDPKWRDMATAPRDGTLIRLLVEFTEHATEDSEAMPCPTIGANSFDHTGEDLWQFAGWSWEQDCFTRGAGEPIGWLPMLDSPHADPAEVERLRYKAELYDEVWELATGLGYMNVTTAISNLRKQLAEQATLVKWWKDHLAAHIAILFGASGHSPDDAEKNADDVIKRAERLAPTVARNTEPAAQLQPTDSEIAGALQPGLPKA